MIDDEQHCEGTPFDHTSWRLAAYYCSLTTNDNAVIWLREWLMRTRSVKCTRDMAHSRSLLLAPFTNSWFGRSHLCRMQDTDPDMSRSILAETRCMLKLSCQIVRSVEHRSQQPVFSPLYIWVNSSHLHRGHQDTSMFNGRNLDLHWHAAEDAPWSSKIHDRLLSGSQYAG